MSRLLFLLALFVPLQAASQPHPNDLDGDGWFDRPVDEAQYPRYRAQPPYYYGPDPRSFRSREERCEWEYRQYRESIDCFNRFRNQNGSVRGEAYQYCAPVADPSPRCGPPRNW
jgi:hypothetical protein